MMSHRALSTGYPFNCPPKSDFYTLFHVTGRRQWYLRQTRDQFVKAAHVAQYRSRAAFKLSQLDEHHRFLDRAKCVIDLGAAPGSWSQLMTYRVRRNCQTQGPPRILAVDLLPMKPIEGVHFIQGDFLHETTGKRIMDACRGAAPDILMSDMAPNLSGHHDMDHIKSVELVREALRLARAILAPGKSTVFLAKVFQGRLLQDLLEEVKKSFQGVTLQKPEASRKESSEVFILARGLRQTQA